MESTQQTQQPPPPSTRPRLERLRDERAIAGVASGVARYLGIDVAWVRIGFVVAALFGGSGVLLYVIGWLAMPEEGERESIAVEKTGGLEGAGSWIGIGLIVLAGMIVLGNTGFIQGDLLFAAVLVVAGVLLYRGDLGNRSDSSTPGYDGSSSVAAPISDMVSSAELAQSVESADDSVEDVSPYGPPPTMPPTPPDPAFQARPTPPRERSPLGRIALAATLIVVGIMGVGQSAGWFDPTLRHYAAAVLVVFGAALLISSFFGRARWLIIVGLLFAPLLLAMALLKVPFEGGFGDPRYEPAVVQDVKSEYRLMAGELVLDLTDLELAEGEEIEVEASVVFGRLEVIVPPDLGLDVLAQVDAGEMFVDGSSVNESRSGGGDNINIRRTIEYGGTGKVVLDAHVGFGVVEIHQIEASQ
jgi:phage shock protein PspC (stress-responsive transcriptional regulator)